MTQTPLAIYKWHSFVDSNTFLIKGFCQVVTQIYNARQHIAIILSMHACISHTKLIFQISYFKFLIF